MDVWFVIFRNRRNAEVRELLWLGSDSLIVVLFMLNMTVMPVGWNTVQMMEVDFNKMEELSKELVVCVYQEDMQSLGMSQEYAQSRN